MKLSTILRWCLVLEWVFIGASIVASSLLEPSLPEPLAAWLRAESEGDLTAREIMLFIAVVPLLVSMIVATVGLLCLRRWAAWLYLITNVVGTLLMTLTGPTVEHAFADALDEIGIVLSGMVIAIAFFTDSLIKKVVEQNPPPLPRAPQKGHSDGEG